MAPFLSYHSHLGLSVWCMPCLIPLPRPRTPPQIPLLSRLSGSIRLAKKEPCWSRTSGAAGAALYVPCLPAKPCGRLERPCFLFLATVPHLDCCPMRTYERGSQSSGRGQDCSRQHSNQETVSLPLTVSSMQALSAESYRYTWGEALDSSPFRGEDPAAQRGPVSHSGYLSYPGKPAPECVPSAGTLLRLNSQSGQDTPVGTASQAETGSLPSGDCQRAGLMH